MNRAAQRPWVLALGGAAVIFWTAPQAPAGAAEVSIDDIPAPVRETILREADGAKIKEVEQETQKSRTIYEAEWERDGGEFEIEIDVDGTIISWEVDGRPANDWILGGLPAAARNTIMELAGDAAIHEVEQESEHGIVIFEAEWVAGGAKFEASVTADGALIEIEERVPADQVPAVVASAIAKRFGANAKIVIQRKTIVVYEVEAKVQGKETELYIYPTGRVHQAKDDRDDDDHGDDSDDDDDDDNRDDD